MISPPSRWIISTLSMATDMKKYRIEWSEDSIIGIDMIVEAESVAKAFQIFYDSCRADRPVILNISEFN